MRSIKVYFSNGDHLFTSVNGTDAEILYYYIGSEFNFGNGELVGLGPENDIITIAIKVEFLD
jgi:hypothetical protein